MEMLVDTGTLSILSSQTALKTLLHSVDPRWNTDRKFLDAPHQHQHQDTHLQLSDRIRSETQ